MTPLALAAVLAIVIPLSYLTWTLVATDRSARRSIEINLGLVKGGPKHSSVPMSERLRELSRKVTPSGYTAKLDKRLAAAGRPKAWPLDRVLMAKPLLALGGFAFALLFFFALRDPSFWSFVRTASLTVSAYFVPDLLLKNTAEKRRAAMQIALPNALDQMLISVEAGVGFEAALNRAAENSSGPLAEEFVRTLQDVQVGRSRREAYLDLAERASFPELRSFLRAVVQADEYGIAIANVLRTQAKEMRIKRRQRAEEHAMKIPVKILFPLIFAILPALFIVVLGPTVLSIMKIFGG
ncbi:hypothetical protein GCM10012320_12040 [Sinomonas cellulolyticus]|uniref:Type II secretion system F family protein n=1 Tax=Sinomonas cellulolyticus TaxID=2801916 RepID=A0ABS1JZ84_9MICC|nr:MULTISPECIES: type II secretion system F family protein [Sinomonas]MBL0704645.1 type II secretion system F family protein [Sinomonas cellulolyticus]GHG46152.1 hypothetical protein GCM10012320_12040 [Sinomonas sp. KCTC 49339]